MLLYGSWEFRVGQQTVQPVPIAVFAPVLIGCALAVLCFSPQPGMDRGAARDLRLITLPLLAGCLALATVGLAVATHSLTGELTTRGACRDLAGFLGLALLGAAVLGAVWFWILPVLAAMIPMLGLHGAGLVSLLVWPLRSDQSSSATVTALVLLVVGFVALAVPRSRWHAG